jgi:protein O-GlcNAc transferase
MASSTTTDLLREAVALQRRGAVAEAAARYKEVLRAEPNNSDAYYHLGMLSCQAGHFDEGTEFARKALACDARHANAQMLLGRALSALGSHDEAIKSLQQAIALAPDLAKAHGHLADILSDLGREAEAIYSYDCALALTPDCAEDWLNRGLALHAVGRQEEALGSFERAIAAKPEFARAHLERANLLWRLHRQHEALESVDRALARDPSLVEAWHSRGSILYELGRYPDALAACDKALALKPDLVEAWLGRGNALSKCTRYEDALATYEKALARKPDLAEAWLGSGNALLQLKKHEEASAAYDKALALEFDLAKAWLGRGNVFYELKRFGEAFAAYDKALALDCDLAGAWLGRGNVCFELRRYTDALEAFDKALTLEPNVPEAWLGRGNVLFEARRDNEALEAYDKALALDSNLAGAWIGRGSACFEHRRYDDALDAYDRALSLNPDRPDAWLGRGNVCHKCTRPEEAVSNYAKVLTLDPEYPFVKGLLLHQKMLSCDWESIGDLIAEINSDIVSGKRSAVPFGYQAISHSASDLKRCAEIFAADKYPQSQTPLFNADRFPRNDPITEARPPTRKKIRIGYLGDGFRQQATSYLMVGALELHDKSKFELYGFDNGWDDQSEIRRRVEAPLRKMIDVRSCSDERAASIIREHEIDILVNLNVFFGDQRNGVFAKRPAPIQINYLGFPGTLGAPYLDYIIADRWVIPPADRSLYTEKVIYLPECYQVNDRKKAISVRQFARSECGLPQSGFVFCCFNNTYKITPDLFACWARILRKVNDSVLWLLDANASVAANLRREAGLRDIDPNRLIFAKHLPLPDHLARHRLADLFLDTLPYNAHTTASDALWAGLPVLTQIGTTFPGRVSASLLNAVGLPELITSSAKAYETLAVQLAANPEKLATIKAKLANNRLTTPLFDTALYARRLDAAYVAIYERYRAGLAPDHISIS